MPTPMPIIAAISGEKFGTTKRCVSSSSRATPMPETGQRGDHRQAHGDHRAEGQQHDDERGRDADPLARPGRGGRRRPRSGCPRARPGSPGVRRPAAVETTFLTAPVGMSAVSVVNWTWAKAMLPCGAIWWAPAGENGLVTPCDVGQRPHAGHHLVDGRLVVRDGSGRVEHDVGRVARLGREALRQDVLRLLRRRVARGELVLEVGAHHLGDDGDADDGDDPEHQHEPPPVVAVPGQRPRAVTVPSRSGRGVHAAHLARPRVRMIHH